MSDAFDSINCDVCFVEMPVDYVRIIPDERTVCQKCYDTYAEAAMRVVNKSVHLMEETEQAFDELNFEYILNFEEEQHE